MKSVVIIGAGAAGLMAASAACACGHRVTVLEKNEKAGKKIYITGKGRCNLTNACDTAEFFDHVVSNPKFLYSSIYDFDHTAVMDYFESRGCRLKTERGQRVFPESDHASDVTRTLVEDIRARGGRIRYHQTVSEILVEKDPQTGAGKAAGVRLEDGSVMKSDAVIIATGGMSYASTGSTGDGYRFARECGHTVTACRPSLVPFTVKEAWPLELQGLALKNVAVKIPSGRKGKPLFEGFGELLFTHFGISGPLVLTASTVCDFEAHPEGYTLFLDLKPAIPEDELEARIIQLFAEVPSRQFAHAIRPLFPQRLADVMPAVTGIDAARTAKSFTAPEIRKLAECIRAVPLTVTGNRGFTEAVITKGGVSTKEIDPSTMESRLISGLYFAGEVIDVDAVTGGFNLQIAWSTGHLAGASIG